MREKFVFLISLLLLFVPLKIAAAGSSQGGCIALPDPFPGAPLKILEEESSDSPPVLDLLAIYIAQAGSAPEIRQYLLPQVAEMNQDLANSQAPALVRLLDVVEAPASVIYQSTPPPDFLLILLNNPDVKTLRDAYGADFVTIILPVEMMPPNVAGLGFLTNFSEVTYSSLSVGALRDGLQRLLAHELGHNLGLPHDKENSQGDGGPYSPRAYGHWGALSNGTRFFDIMSYGSACPGGCETQVPFYSNPEVLFGGVPMGIAGEREAALVLREDALRRASQHRRSKVGDCLPGAKSLCLGGARFRVEARWETSVSSGDGQAVSLTSDTGFFWFFDQNNVEVIVKVLNGCGVNSRYWVFASGLTNTKVTLTVTDTVGGITKTYTNPQGTAFKPVQDTGAFATCQ